MASDNVLEGQGAPVHETRSAFMKDIMDSSVMKGIESAYNSNTVQSVLNSDTAKFLNRMANNNYVQKALGTGEIVGGLVAVVGAVPEMIFLGAGGLQIAAGTVVIADGGRRWGSNYEQAAEVSKKK